MENIAVSQFIESKIRKWFQMNNLKRNGCVTKSDNLEIADSLINEFQANEDKAKPLRNWMENAWNILVEKGRILSAENKPGGISEKNSPLLLEVAAKWDRGEKVSENDYAGAYLEVIRVNKALFEETFENMVGSFFDIFDVGDKGYITSENLQKGMKCLGLTNGELVDLMFKEMVKGKEGKLDKQTYVGHWTEFMTGEDQNAVIARIMCRM